MISRSAFAFAALFAMSACAPTMPTFSGGRTTPAGKVDTHVGAAYRVPLGDLVADAADGSSRGGVRGLLGVGGAAPVAAARYGLRQDLDIGIAVSTTQAAIPARLAFELDSIGRGRLLVGVTPTAGWLGAADTRGHSFGVQVPVLAAIQISGVYEGWAGLRVGVDYASGSLEDDTAARAVRAFAGGVVGFSVGFRLIAVLAELAVDYERWTGSARGANAGFAGVALTPAFAVRLRL